MLFLFLLAAFVQALPAKTRRQTMYGNWTTIQCTDYGVTDAALPANLRWSAVDAQGAWEEVCNAWNNETPLSGDTYLKFPEYVMNYFHGPDNWNCEDIEDGACSPGVLMCTPYQAPAGWLIGNSFANIHDIHKQTYNDLGIAQGQMQSQMGVFASTFSPVENEGGIEIIKDIVDAAAFVVGIASAYFWNKVADSVLESWKSSGNRSFSKDSFNAMTALVINSNKDALSQASQQLSEQNSLSSALGLYIEAWQQAQSDFLKQLFSGTVETLGQLGSLMQDGQMDWPTGNGPDLSDFENEVQKLLYAQMIPKAWQHGVTSRSPIVLESTDDCSSVAGNQMSTYMSDDTAAQTHMCMNGKIYYLVNAVSPPMETPVCQNLGICGYPPPIFVPLPGGEFNTLQGGAWGGVRIDDIVIASYQGWLNNGNKNGWSVPDFLSLIQDGANPSDLFADGIQTAGYNSIPFCSSDNLDQITARIIQNNETPGPYWPCE